MKDIYFNENGKFIGYYQIELITTLSGTQRIILNQLINLCYNLNYDNISYSLLMSVTGLGKNTILRNIRDLEEMKLIEISESEYKRNYNPTNHYEVCMDNILDMMVSLDEQQSIVNGETTYEEIMESKGSAKMGQRGSAKMGQRGSAKMGQRGSAKMGQDNNKNDNYEKKDNSCDFGDSSADALDSHTDIPLDIDNLYQIATYNPTEDELNSLNNVDFEESQLPTDSISTEDSNDDIQETEFSWKLTKNPSPNSTEYKRWKSALDGIVPTSEGAKRLDFQILGCGAQYPNCVIDVIDMVRRMLKNFRYSQFYGRLISDCKNTINSMTSDKQIKLAKKHMSLMYQALSDYEDVKGKVA